MCGRGPVAIAIVSGRKPIVEVNRRGHASLFRLNRHELAFFDARFSWPSRDAVRSPSAHAILVTGSGSSWSHGLFAPRPSPSGGREINAEEIIAGCAAGALRDKPSSPAAAASGRTVHHAGGQRLCNRRRRRPETRRDPTRDNRRGYFAAIEGSPFCGGDEHVAGRARVLNTGSITGCCRPSMPAAGSGVTPAFERVVCPAR